MRTRRSLFIASALLAMVTLLASGAAAQTIGAVTVDMVAPPVGSHDELTVSWTYTHSEASLEMHLASHADLEDLGFFVYYTKGMDTNSLNSVAKLSAAMSMDGGLGKADKRTTDAINRVIGCLTSDR